MHLHILEKLPYFQAEQDLEELKGLIECSQGTLVSLDFPNDSYHLFTLQYLLALTIICFISLTFLSLLENAIFDPGTEVFGTA